MAVDRMHLADNEHREPTFLNTLRSHGIKAILVAIEADLDNIRASEMPNLALIDVEALPRLGLADCLQRCSQLKLPVIALVPQDLVAGFGTGLDVDDFVMSPPRSDELVARARRVLRRTASSDAGDAIRIGDLVISRANYEVSVLGKRVNLRFKEYELLLLMTTNPGRVYSRETLLNQVWGYDYLGGTRTVDVHIRRLRSKIEDADHSFIETVWNVGYRVKNIDQTG